MKQIDTYKEYCTGCGLCHSVRDLVFSENDKGFHYPNLQEEDLDFCQRICPAGNDSICKEGYTIWGNVVNSYVGWALDKIVRKSASSGGVLTAICCYLLDEGIVDGVIQTTVGENEPYSTKTVISRSSDEVKKCVGSRYSSSSPLYNITQLVKKMKNTPLWANHVMFKV